MIASVHTRSEHGLLIAVEAIADPGQERVYRCLARGITGRDVCPIGD